MPMTSKEMVEFMVKSKLLELELDGMRMKLHESALFPVPAKSKKGETGLPDDSLESDAEDLGPHELLRRDFESGKVTE